MANRWAPFLDSVKSPSALTVASGSLVQHPDLSLAITTKIDTRVSIYWSFVTKCFNHSSSAEILEMRLHNGNGYLTPYAWVELAQDEVVTVTQQATEDVVAGQTRTYTLWGQILSFVAADYRMGGSTVETVISVVALPLDGIDF